MTAEPKVTNGQPLKTPQPTVSLTRNDRVFVIEGDKDKIEDHVFQLQVLSAFGSSAAGNYKLDGVKVTVTEV